MTEFLQYLTDASEMAFNPFSFLLGAFVGALVTLALTEWMQ